MKKGAVLILIMILINLTLVITPTLATLALDENKDLIYYNSGKSQEFSDLSPQDKQDVWSNAQAWDNKIRTRNEKQTAIKELTDQVIEQRIEANKLTRGYIKIMELGGDVLLNNFEKAGLNDFLGLDLSEIYEHKKELGQYLKDTYGIDFDIQETKIEKITGFDNSKLKWSQEAGENKNIIGDGNVWLDLEKIPTGVTGIEYKEGTTKDGKYSGGSFILTHNSGIEIVLTPETTNPDGTIKFLSQYYEDYKEPGDKKLFRIDGINLPPPNLRNFNFPTTTSNGQVIFTENGFELTGDAQVKYSQFLFTGTKLSESSQESYVQFYEDKFIIKGTKFERQDYLISQPTQDDFIIHFGTIEYLDKDIKDVASLNLDGLVKQASFEDMRIGTSVEIKAGENFVSIGQIHFIFNKQGELTHVSKDDVNNGKLIPVTIGLEKDSYLKKLYDQSGYTVKKIIDTSTQGETMGYNDIKKLFYGDSILKMQAREIKTESYQDNFVSIMGENVFVGGKGDIEILKPLNSLTGVDAKDFSVNVGELPLRFSESGIWKIRGGHEGETFNIDSITAIKDGELMDTILLPNTEKKPVPSFTINTKDSKGKIYSESESFTAGRQVIIGPFGSTIDIHLDVPMSDMPDIADNKGSPIPKTNAIEEYFEELAKPGREKFIEELMQSEFEFKIDFYIPGKGTAINKNKFKGIVADFVFPKLRKFVSENPQDIGSGIGEKEFRPESFQKIEEMVLIALGNIKSDKFSPGRYTIAMKNNPKIPMYKNRDNNDIGSETIKIGISTPDKIEINPIVLGKNKGEDKSASALFIKDILELTTRAPDTTKGSTPYFFAGVDFRKTNYYPPPHLYYLWQRVLGKSEPDLIMRYVTGTNILYSEDEAFLKEYFFNKYLEDPTTQE